MKSGVGRWIAIGVNENQNLTMTSISSWYCQHRTPWCTVPCLDRTTDVQCYWRCCFHPKVEPIKLPLFENKPIRSWARSINSKTCLPPIFLFSQVITCSKWKMVFISILKKLSKPNLGFNPKRHSDHYCYTIFIYRFNRYSNTSQVKVASKASHFWLIWDRLHDNAISYDVNALIAI